jgi:hypothetical protein
MAVKPLWRRDFHAAEDQRPPLHQAVHVVSKADARKSGRHAIG